MPKKKTTEKLQLEMKDTLESMSCMEVVSVSSRNGDIRFLSRVNDEPRWLKILNEFLEKEEGWYSFIGKKYFINQGRLVYGWVLIFESEELDKSVQDIRKLFTTCLDIVDNSTPKIETKTVEEGVVEVPLPNNAGYSSEMQKRVRSVR